MRWMWWLAVGVGFGWGCADASDACRGARPMCTDQALTGACRDAVVEDEATCDGDTWSCEDGLHLAQESQCEWPTSCVGAAPRCDNQPFAGQCLEDPQVVSAECGAADEWECPAGFHLEGATGCVPPSGCGDAPAPTCTDQELTGDCSDAVTDLPADCVGGEFVCPDGYHFEDAVDCTWPSDCVDPAPSCFEGGDCAGATAPAECDGADWLCPDGFASACAYPCGAGEPAPDECWDQGPGECSDTTQPASCVEASWQCPPGWDFGGFGEGCEFPG